MTTIAVLRRGLIALLLLFLAACSAQQLGRKSPLAEPEIVIEQISAVAPAARGISGGVTVQFRVRVRNVADQPVTLKRIDLSSILYGSYSIDPMSRPFDLTIKPKSESSVDVWATGQIVDPSITGANGPVTMRAVALFDSPSGQLQTVITQQVRSRTAVD